jgi:hypothetical protein
MVAVVLMQSLKLAGVEIVGIRCRHSTGCAERPSLHAPAELPQGMPQGNFRTGAHAEHDCR